MRMPLFHRAAAGTAVAAGPRALVRPNRGLPLMLLLPFLLLAVFVGVVGGLDSPPLVAIVGTAVLSVLMVFVLPLHGMFWCLFVLTFLLQGSAVYFLKLRPAAWLAFGLAILFFCRALLDLVVHKREQQRMRKGDGSTVELAAVLFVAAFVISLVFNRVPKSQIFSAAKAMLPMFSVLFALYWFRWKEQHLELSWRMMFWVVLVQVPVVLYQHFSSPRQPPSIPSWGPLAARLALAAIVQSWSCSPCWPWAMPLRAGTRARCRARRCGLSRRPALPSSCWAR